MAAQYNAPFDEPAEVREGFLCPLCLKDLQSFYQLQSHYEEEHSTEDWDVKGQLKNLVQIAKKAKNKLLKKDGGERAEGGSQDRYEAFSYGGVDPCMWDPQEIGAMRSHLFDFKKHRAARIDHYVVEVNKLIIRLEKLTSFDRTNTESAKIRAIERSVVPWVSDQDVPFCPDCGNKFTIRNRRHHCRLCGSIMCRRCTELITIPFANKLTSACKHSASSHGSPNLSPNTSAQTSRRGSISSLSSVSSVLEEKDDDKIRCCQHCKDTLLKREMQMDEKAHTPEIVKVYQKLRACMERVDEKAPEYIRMAQSINAGETTYNLDHANNLRIEVQRLYELIDALSKKILTLGLNEEPKPHPKNLQLQKMVRYSATLFVQEKLLGLMSLPTKEKYEELKEKRKRENELKLQREQQAALEAQRRRDEKRKDFVPRSSDVLNGEPQQAGRIRKVEGWLPTSGVPRNRETSDPLLQQIENITSYIQQAQAAGRVDEVHMLQENLRQLQDEYDQQQVETAIRMSRELAEGEAMQREQLEVLRKREESREQRKSLSQHSRAHSLDFRDHRQVTVWQDKHTAALDLQLPRRDPIPAELSPPLTPPDTRPILPLRISPVLPNKSAPLNPFEDEESEPEPAAAEKIQQNGSKEYNPFDEDEEENPEEAAESVQGVTQVSSNPFETSPERDYTAPGPTNPFEEEDDGPCPGNPFEESDDLGANEEEVIEEDLLLQQIDNIKAYIFDAKHSGRLDEVDLLTENLRELKKTLAKQKGQK
ncbi:rabenosyn-5 [Engystomops pustulosus]|uniref:rabenosyn-5 n=1 Tax=Engystomops pustulosus TaxID=76066 RepID=UPI003AFA5FB6